MRFVPSQHSLGAFDADSISATAELLAAATGSGVVIGQSVAAARARKRRRKRRRKRKPAPAPTPVVIPQQDYEDDAPAQAPAWVLPLVIVGSLGLLGYAYMQSQKED
jgi:hypothetical protein